MILERIARNLPCRQIDMIRTETELGTVYMATGKEPNGTYHGVWGFRGMARTCSFGRAFTLDEVRKMILDDAVWFGREMNKRDLYDESAKGGRA